MARESPKHMEQLCLLLSNNNNNNNNSNDDDYNGMMDRVRNIGRELSKECGELEDELSKLFINWNTLSVSVKAAIHNLLNNLTTYSIPSPGGISSSLRIQQMVKQDIPRLAVELNHIQNFRSYLGTALQLEALIGDLEDAAFSVMRQRTGNEHESTQSNFLQAIRFTDKIEDLLVSPLQFKGQWCHLMKAVDSRVDKILALLRPQVLASHRALLSSLGWPPKVFSSKIESGNISVLPNPLLLMQKDKQKAYSESFLVLCALQNLKTRRDERQLRLSRIGKNQNLGLWAIDELVYPITSKVEFYFSKWTDQPEFIFALVYKITKDFVVGVDDILQPLIDKAKLVGFSVKEAWVSAMVQMLSDFLAKQVFSILFERYKEEEKRGEVVSSWLHLVDLMVNFDKQLLSLMSSEPYLFYEDSERRGESLEGFSVFSLFFDRPDWLKRWAKIELKYSIVKLKEEMENGIAWFINAKQGVSSAVNKSTENFILYSREDYNAPLITESALKLAWDMIERCKTLPDVFLKIKFIRFTSVKVIWYFMKVLVSRGKSIEFSVDDDDSLVKLCGLINAAEYCKLKLQECSDDIYFLEMRIAERESKEFLEDDVHDNYLFFGEEIKSLVDMGLNWLMQIITGLLSQFESFSFHYIRNMVVHSKQQQEEDHRLRVSETMGISVSDDLLEALDALKSRLCVIKMSLNPKDFSDLWRNVANALDSFLYDSIFTNDSRFSGKGSKQFEADMHALFLVFNPFCARPEAFFPRIRDALRL